MDYVCYVKITKKPKYIINDNIYYWGFTVSSELHETDFVVDNIGWSLGFLDFFIDEHIKEVSIMLANTYDY